TVGAHIILTKLTKPVRALPTLLSKTDLAGSNILELPFTRFLYRDLLAENLNVDSGLLQFKGGAKSAHGHGQGAELGPPYSKGVLNQHMNTDPRIRRGCLFRAWTRPLGCYVQGVLIQAHPQQPSNPSGLGLSGSTVTAPALLHFVLQIPTNCVAYGSFNKGKIGGITYHRFPKNPAIRQKCTNAVKRRIGSRQRVVCYVHRISGKLTSTELLCRVCELEKELCHVFFHHFPREFTASLRRILLHKELEESDSGNALILNRSLIFSINKRNKNETDEINFSTPSWRSLEDDDRATSNNNDLLDDESIVNILRATTEIGRDKVEYVAGYVARKRPKEQWPGSECNPDATSAAAVLNYAYFQPAFSCPEYSS
ncbi:hypothetical protein J6590_098440, partial [Homalodisca vitripennis]